jgi:hypothetical protein
MATILFGDDINYTPIQILNNLLIERQHPGVGTDLIPSALSLLTKFNGITNYLNSNTFNFSIFNNSNFSINVGCDTGVSFLSGPTDTILPNSTKSYIFSQNIVNELVIYTVGDSNIPLPNADMLIGNSSNIPKNIAITGDLSLDQTGHFTTTKINGNLLGTTVPVSGNTLISDATSWNSKEIVGDLNLSSDGILSLSKQAADVATTVDISLSGLPTIDTVKINDGDGILVKNQTNPIENGIYIASFGTWTRSSDMATGSVFPSTSIGVLQGTQQNTFYMITTTGTVGTDPIVYNQIIPGTYTNADISVNSKGLITNISAGTPSIPLLENHILIGNASNMATDVALTGDISIVSNGSSIVNTLRGESFTIIPGIEGIFSGNTTWNNVAIVGDVSLADTGVTSLPVVNADTGLRRLANFTVDKQGRVVANDFGYNIYSTAGSTTGTVGYNVTTQDILNGFLT